MTALASVAFPRPHLDCDELASRITIFAQNQISENMPWPAVLPSFTLQLIPIVQKAKYQILPKTWATFSSHSCDLHLLLLGVYTGFQLEQRRPVKLVTS